MLLTKNLSENTLNVEEAYIVWRSLVDRYITIEHFNVLKNHVHDQDLKKRLQNIIEDFMSEAKTLEEMTIKYEIKGPDKAPRDQNMAVNSEAFTDQGIAEALYRFMRLDVNLLFLSLKNTATNIDVLQLSTKLTTNSLKRVDSFIKYMKSKNWILYPPDFVKKNEEVKEDIAINEVFLLWDHLVYRYNNIRLTQVYSAYTEDKVFAELLTVGIKMLKKQAKEIEDKLLYYGVTLPKPYAESTPVPKSNQLNDDRFMFNHIFRGIQDALALHGSSVQEVIRSDELRAFFMNLTFDEMDVMVRMTKYGNANGWTNKVPLFGMTI